MDCPSEKSLAEYVAGTASDEEAGSTATHIETCDRCRCAVEWLQTFPQPSDPDDSDLFDATGAYVGSATGFFDGASISEARFDPKIFGPSDSDKALGMLDKYEIIEVLGYGGMGVVFRAFDTQLRRPVAIKILNQGLAASPIARRRFIREARAAAVINHGNVVTIYSVEEQHDPPLLAMELVAGKSLRDHIREQGQLNPIEALRIAGQIASGLAAAHSHGVIHRDVKPGNIMLEDGIRRVKLTDFGLARAAIDNVELTSHDAAVGTPAYMAPEQVLGEKVDSRADLFGLGCVIHAMLTGYSPFHGRTAWQIAHKVTEWEPPPLSKTHPSVPSFLSEIVEQLLKKQPEDRFQSAMEVAELINAHLAMLNQTRTDELQQMAAGDSPWPKPTIRRPVSNGGRRGPWIIAIAASMLALLAVLIAVHNASTTPETSPISITNIDPGDSVSALPKVSGEITVAQDAADADFDSISEALQRAAPGAIIRVLDSAEYTTPLLIDDNQRWRGVQLIADQQATLASPTDSAVIRIHATQDVVVRGFQMKVAFEQHGIEITGDCAGLQIGDLDVTRLDATTEVSSLALFYLHNAAAGTEEDPILIEDVTVRDGDIGVFIGEESGDDLEQRPASQWIQVRNCDMAATSRSVGYHVILGSGIANVRINNNLLATASCGVSLALRLANCADNIAIEQNTFYDLGSFLVLNDSTQAQGNISFERNLIADTTYPVFQGNASDLQPDWYHDNYWLGWTGGSADLGPIAKELFGFSFINTSPDAADYLRVQATSNESVPPEPFPGRYSLSLLEAVDDQATEP